MAEPVQSEKENSGWLRELPQFRGPLRWTGHELTNYVFDSLQRINNFFKGGIILPSYLKEKVHQRDVRNVNKCLPIARAFTKKVSQGQINLSAD